MTPRLSSGHASTGAERQGPFAKGPITCALPGTEYHRRFGRKANELHCAASAALSVESVTYAKPSPIARHSRGPRNPSSTVTMSQPDSPRTGLSHVLALVNGAKWPVPDGMEPTYLEQRGWGACSIIKDGNVDMAAVAAHDPVAKKFAQEGRLMQVLS